MESVPAIDPEPPVEAAPPFSFGFLVAWSVVGFAAFLTLGATAQFFNLAWGIWFSEIFVFAAIAILGFRLNRVRPWRAMGLTRFDGRSLGIGAAFGLLNFFAWAVPAMALAQAVFPKSVVDQFDSSELFARHSNLELAIVLVGVSLAAPFGEELFFRGFLQRGIEVHRGAPRAIAVTAIVFSAFHFDPVGFLARVALGVLFGLLFWKTRSLWASMGAHAANNALSSALFLSFRDADEGDLVWWVPVLCFVLGNIGLFLLARRFSGHWEVAEPLSDQPEEPPVSPTQSFVPWVLGALASAVLLVAVDWRGVRLNVTDALLGTTKDVRERTDVIELRAAARRGDAAIEDYESLVRNAVK